MIPVTDSASIIWAPNAFKLALSPLSQVQRLGAQAIVRAFWTVSLLVVESEASIVLLDRRLLKSQLTTWVKCYSKLQTH